MKKQLKHQEKGSILVEIIAVVALLGVMGPLLFRQVSDRNEEVENINIASEMRIMKEAFASYILSYHSDIIETCTNSSCPASVNLIESYLPAGYEENTSNYTFLIVRDETGNGNNTLQGFIIPNLGDLGLLGLSLKRVARVATLIGADGGILRKGANEINGTGGAWHLSTDYFSETGYEFSPDDHLFIATTGIDTFVPTVAFEDFDQSNILMPDQGYASRRLHAWNYFSVGQVDATDTSACFEQKHNVVETIDGKTVAQSDNIFDAGQNNCDPLFWVGASGDTGVAGNVFVKNQLHLRSNPNGKSTVTISTEPINEDMKPTSVLIEGTATTSVTPSVEENEKRRIVVYTSNGKEAVVINGQGEIISTGSAILTSTQTIGGTEPAAETLSIKQGRIETNAKASKATADAGTDQAYKIDPRFISVMGDIRLESRGGAKLSDILPTYQLKTVQTISSDYYNPAENKQILMPVCPNEHVPAIVVTPVKWYQTTERDVVDSVIKHVVSSSDGLSENAATIPNTYPILPKVQISYDDSSTEFLHTHTLANKPDLGKSWTVSLSYVQNGTEITTILEPIIATVHTYCVYMGVNSIEERDTDDSLAVGQ